MHRPLKKSKSESFDTADHLREFSTTHFCFTLFSSTKIEIVHLFVVCPALSHCVSRKKETVFIYTTLSNK